jgi:hypothetical protein
LGEECIERYFLAPGSSGPIGSVYVADEDLLEIFGVAELEQARRQLIKSIPHVTILRSRFSGLTSPLQGRSPDYVRILVFLCWMQTTKMRQRGDRDFRQLLSKQLGEDFTGFKMNGLDMMWEHLQEFLLRVHGIDLVLPDIIPSISRIGRTLQMAFPTWRDKAALRKLRQYIAPAHSRSSTPHGNAAIESTRQHLSGRPGMVSSPSRRRSRKSRSLRATSGATSFSEFHLSANGYRFRRRRTRRSWFPNLLPGLSQAD